MKLDSRANDRELSPADLRGILKYVPLWRNHTFVVAIDGAVIEKESINNLMLELAVLRNLGIRLTVIYGIGAQIKRIATEQKIKISDTRGQGPTDSETLRVAISASGLAGHIIERGLTHNGLKCARVNAIRGTDRGIIKGIDQQFSGKVDKIDSDLLSNLMEQEIIPVLSPLAFTRDGFERRINSDSLAGEVAISLKASKLIFLTPYKGLTYDGKLRLNADVAEVRKILEENPALIDEPVRSKAAQAVQTILAGTPRAHIIDSRIHDGLLREVFSKVGIGSMIHSNPYSQIRKARKKDTGSIYALTKAAVREEQLRPRTRQSIDANIADYFVYEIDESIIGCFRLSTFNRSGTAELGSVFVNPAYQGRRIGKAMVDYAIEEGIRLKKKKVVALSTQSLPFFRDTCGFSMGVFKDLPKPLRELAEQNGRNSAIFVYNL